MGVNDPTPTVFVPYHAFDNLIMRGTRAQQPLATKVTPGTLYNVTDEQAVERSNGTAWESYSSSTEAEPIYYTHTQGAAATTWTITHNLGAIGYPVTITNTAGALLIPDALVYTSVNVTTATFAVAQAGFAYVSGGTPGPGGGGGGGTTNLDYKGDYAPSTYNDGDIVVAADGVAYMCVKSGVTTPPEPWPGGGAPANVAYTTQANTFSQNQTISTVSEPAMILTKTGQVSKSRLMIMAGPDVWLARNISYTLATGQLNLDDITIPGSIMGLNDANELAVYTFPAGPNPAVLTERWKLKANGDAMFSRDVYEKARTVPMGHWIDVPFNAANFWAQAGGGTWTIGAAAILRNKYTLIGNTMTWSIYISWFSGGNVVAGAVSSLAIRIPGGFGCPGNIAIPAGYGIDNGARTEFDASPGSGTLMTFTKRTGANFTTGAVGFIATMTFEVYV